MTRLLAGSLAVLLILSAAAVAAPPMPPDLAGRVKDVTDAVLKHHIDPPARQLMIVAGLNAMYRASGVPAPLGLGRRVSEVATPEQLAALLRESWSEANARPIDAEKLQDALFEGLFAVVPGGAELLTAKDARVAESMAGNRYVGIHVALGWDKGADRPTFAEVFPGGPADRGGIQQDDLLLEVDGADTKGQGMRPVIDRLRGDEGTDVTIKVRGPKDAKTRTAKLTRGQLPHPTIEGLRKQTSGDWALRLDGPDPIGYLRIKEISASTPHELRKLARQMEGEGLRALVIDLRGTQFRTDDQRMHPAVLLADALLESGPIGRVRTVQGETTYKADPDALFRGWPIAVLIDRGTSGTAEWLAAALQDNHRATIVGWPTGAALGIVPQNGRPIDDVFPRPFEAVVTSAVPVGDGRYLVSMVTGFLERGDGRPLVGPIEGLSAGSPGQRRPGGGIQPQHRRLGGGVHPDHRLREIDPRAPEVRKSVEKPEPPARPIDRTYAAAVKANEAARSPSVDPAIGAAVKVLRQYLPTRASEKS